MYFSKYLYIWLDQLCKDTVLIGPGFCLPTGRASHFFHPFHCCGQTIFGIPRVQALLKFCFHAKAKLEQGRVI